MQLKLVFWRSKIKSLIKKYTTPYDKNLNITYFHYNDVVYLEKEFAVTFKKYNITNDV